MSEPAAMDTQKTPIRFPSVVAVAAFAGFCIWLGGQVTEVRRDITELKGKHIFTTEEIAAMVEKRVNELWEKKRAAIRMACSLFPSRGVFGDCREVGP